MTETETKPAWKVEWERREEQVRALNAHCLAILPQVAGLLPGDWSLRIVEPRWIHLDRADGMQLSVSINSHSRRMSVSPNPPEMVGWGRERTGIDASMDPYRPVQTLAREITRRVIEPWERKLADLLERQCKEIAQRAQGIDLLQRLANILPQHYAERLDESRKHLEQGNRASLDVGMYSQTRVHGNLVLNAPCSVTFELQVRDAHTALQLAWCLAELNQDQQEQEAASAD